MVQSSALYSGLLQTTTSVNVHFLTLSHRFVGNAAVEKPIASDGLPSPDLR